MGYVETPLAFVCEQHLKDAAVGRVRPALDQSVTLERGQNI